MTPEQEIERIKKDFAEHWKRFENHAYVKAAVDSKDPVKLGEWLSILAYGNTYSPEDLNSVGPLRRIIVSVSLNDQNWQDQVYVKFKSGEDVDLENIVDPKDEAKFNSFAVRIGAKGSMNPSKSKFFFRHSI
jgi:hypothetical protein